MRERAPLPIAENPHHAVELRAALRRNGSGAVSGSLPRHQRPLKLGCAQTAFQALAAPGLLRPGFRMALLSGEVETTGKEDHGREVCSEFRMALLSGEVETRRR